MSGPSYSTQKLLSRYQAWSQSLRRPEGVSTIHVDEVASKVASFYEKIREVIDWREEHLLRRTAIERMLRRRILTQKNGEKIAGPLIFDLIRAGHFPNNIIPETKINEIQKSIDRYIFILNNAPLTQTEKDKTQFFNWLLAIAACETEAILAPPIKEEALMNYMEELMRERIRVNEGIFVIGGLKENDINIQIFIAVRRAMFNLDAPIISFHLLKEWYQNWLNLTPPNSVLEEITKNIHQIQERIESNLNHPLADKFYQICEKYDTPYLILGDVISQNITEAPKILSEPATLENSIVRVYGERFQKLKQRTKRAAVYCTLSIFITKVFMALSLEVPIDKYITGQFSNTALAINIIAPPLLMFLLVITVRPPGKSNLQRVTMEIMKIVYPTEKKDTYELRVPAQSSLALKIFINVFYLLTYLISFGIIIYVLRKLDFGILSMIVFLIFLSLITFAGVRLRQRVKELEVEEKKEGFLQSIWEWFTLPIIGMGRWLSIQLEKHNTLVLIFNSLVDMPFQMFIEFLEQWRYFLKEKKEEIH